MSTKTKARTGQYKGHIILEIVNLDDKGQAIGTPIISFGVKKAKAIMDNLEDVERFIKNHSTQSAEMLDVSKLTEEQKNDLLTQLLAT